MSASCLSLSSPASRFQCAGSPSDGSRGSGLLYQLPALAVVLAMTPGLSPLGLAWFTCSLLKHD